jgi:glucan phosphoethanolaminetransferase (alkaline phosphatase superfamily)
MKRRREEATMSNASELARFAAALFFSGIFWMMILFLIEVRALKRRVRPGLVALAVILLIASAYLMLGVVANQGLLAMPLASR